MRSLLLLAAPCLLALSGCGPSGREPGSSQDGPRSEDGLARPAEEAQAVALIVDGRPRPPLTWPGLEPLPRESFRTGLDRQEGCAVREALKAAGIDRAASVVFYGHGTPARRISWQAIADPKNQLLLGRTHRGTLKLVAGNRRALDRDSWIRHLYRIEVATR